MSFISISSNSIATGEPVSSSVQSVIKNNFDNLDGRLTSLEGGGSTVYPPIVLSVNGDYTSMNGAKGVARTTINFDITITGVRLIVDKAGSSGTTEIDIQYKRGAGSWTSVLTTKPSLASSAGDDATSTNTVLNMGQVSLQAGDLIRMNIDSVQTNGRGFIVRMDYNKT